MAAMNYRQIPALCINLDRRADRWAKVQKQFQKLAWPVERFSAVEYHEETVGGINGRHAGALDSHRGCWRLALERAYPVLAVFEDDVVFPSDFKDIFPQAARELPEWWRFWQLHSSHAKTTAYSRYIVRITSGGWGGHGYLVTAAGCRDLLAIEKYNHCDVLMTKDYLAHGGQPLGMPLPYALCFQQGDADSNIPVTSQARYWRAQRLKYCR
jgi:GR25 family glycosyltransferase involved in LPS biosynthesis